MRNKYTIDSRGLMGKSHDYFQGDKLKKEGDLLYELYTRRKYLENLFQGFSFGEPQTITKVGPSSRLLKRGFLSYYSQARESGLFGWSFCSFGFFAMGLDLFHFTLRPGHLSSLPRAALPRSSRR